MEYIAFRCDCCDCPIDAQNSPIVCKEVVGLAPSAGVTLDVIDHPLPQRVRDVLANPRQNIHRCLDCRAWEYGEDLVDADGAVVVKHADYKTRETFAAASAAAYTQALAARATPPTSSET
jgi:hypothetical protein